MNEKQQNLHTPENFNLDGTVVIKINHPSTSFSSLEFNCLTANNESKQGQRSTRKRKLDNESSAPKGCTLDKIPRIILVDCMKNQPQQTQDSTPKDQKEFIDLKINITCNDCQLNFSSLQKFLDHLNINVELEMKENIPPKEPKSALSSTTISVKSPSRRSRKKIATKNITPNPTSATETKANSSSTSKCDEKVILESDPNPVSEIETEYANEEEIEINIDDDFYLPSPQNTDSDNDNDEDYDPVSPCPKNSSPSKSKRKERPKKDKEKKSVPKSSSSKGKGESESGSHLNPETICEKCGKIYKDKSALRTHFNGVHAARPLVCPHESCEKAFRKPSDLKNHVRIHSIDRPFKCPECPCAFRQPHLLKVHLITHTVPDGRPFKCSVENCSATFTAQFNLWRHERTFHPPSGVIEKPHKCDWSGCTASFFSKTHLAAHMTMHKDERPFKCQVEDCGGSFRTKSHLKRHGAVHSQEFNHLCDLCGKSFKTFVSLRQHEAHVHRPTSGDPKPPSFTRPKKYPCENPGCGRSFTTLTRLTNHQKLHESDTSQMQLENLPQ